MCDWLESFSSRVYERVPYGTLGNLRGGTEECHMARLVGKGSWRYCICCDLFIIFLGLLSFVIFFLKNLPVFLSLG